MDLKILKSQWDRAAAIVLTLVGGLCLLLGYTGVAGSEILAEQTRFIVSGGIGGIFFLGLGATLWVSADLRDEWRKLDRIEHALVRGVLRWVDEPTNGPSHRSAPGVNPVDASARQAGLANAVSAREHA